MVWMTLAAGISHSGRHRLLYTNDAPMSPLPCEWANRPPPVSPLAVSGSPSLRRGGGWGERSHSVAGSGRGRRPGGVTGVWRLAHRDQLDRSASRFNRRARRGGHLVRPDGERAIHSAVAQHLEHALGLRLADESVRGQGLRVDLLAIGEDLEVAQVDDDVFLAEGVLEPAQIRHACRKPCLAALEMRRDARTRAGLLALLAAPGRLDMAGAMPTTDALAPVARASGRSQFVESHSAATSSTRTRCETLLTMPRITGVSSCSTAWCSLCRPSASMVRFCRSLYPIALFVYVMRIFAMSSAPNPPIGER